MKHTPPLGLIIFLIAVSLAAAAPYFLVAFEFRSALKRGRQVIAPEAQIVLRDFGWWLALSGGRFVLGVSIIWMSAGPRYVIGSFWIAMLGWFEWRCYWRIKGRADLYLGMLQQAIGAAEMSKRLNDLEQKLDAGPNDG